MKAKKARLILSAIIALFLAMTFCVFGPLEMVLSSPSEFWFQITDILPTIGLAFLLFFSCAFVLLYALSGVTHLFFPIAFGIVLALYIQGNYTFVDYGTMDGTPIDWSSFGMWPVWNTLIWIVIVAAPVALFFKKRTLCKQIIAYVSIGIVAIETITLGTLFLTTPNKNDASFFASTNNQMTFSEGHNIVVLIADSVDAQTVLKITEEEPELFKEFDGFTFFADTCGTSLYSHESGITLLTGNQYIVGPSFDENVDLAYSNSPFYKALKDYNYSIDLYVSFPSFISGSITDMVNNICHTQRSISSIKDCGNLLYKMVAFRYMPHIAKNHFWFTSMDFLDIVETDNVDAKPFSFSNIELYNTFLNEEILVGNTPNSYKLFWVRGTHAPLDMDRFCAPLDKRIDVNDLYVEEAEYEQTVGVVHMFSTLLNRLKQAGIYNNTTVILASDHGRNMRPNPLLMIKRAGDAGAFKTSYAPVSMIEDYKPTLMEIITNQKTSDRTIFDVSENEERIRPFYVYTYNTDRFYTDLKTTSFPSRAFARNNGTYSLGEIIYFDDSFQYSPYIQKGLAAPEKGYVWTEGNEVVFHFELKNPPTSDLQVSSSFTRKVTGVQRVEVYINGVFLNCFKLSPNDLELNYLIPQSMLREQTLNIKMKLLDVLPQSALYNSTDNRLLGLAYSSMTISKAQTSFIETEILNQPTIKVSKDNRFVIDFSTDATYTNLDLQKNGWHFLEERHRWTSRKSEITFNRKTSSNQQMDLTFWSYPASGDTEVYLNDHFITTLKNNPSVHTETFLLPAEHMNPDGLQTLTFVTDGATSPAAVGQGTDIRNLGIAVHSISFSPAEDSGVKQ